MTEPEVRELWASIVGELTAKGLAVPAGLRFELDGARRRLGKCQWRRNRLTGETLPGALITVSRHLAALNGPEIVGKTIRHEIAHAIAGHAAGHGPSWRAIDRLCGGDGSRCDVSGTTKKVDLPWRATCPGCGKVHQMTRPAKRPLWCRCLGRTFRPEQALAFRLAEGAEPKPPASATAAGVLEMRRQGMGFVAIDKAFGIVGKKGWWSWKIVKKHTK